MKRGGHPEKAVVLLSGGLDSATALAIAAHEGYELFAITFNYGQRHSRELASASLIASASAVTKHLIVDFNLRDIGGSALTSELKVPKKGLKVSGMGTARSKQVIPVTYVPARNTIFLSFALAWAEVLKAGTIFLGANAVDYSGYPDCRPEYLRAFEDMANLATKISVEDGFRFRIKAPLITMTKAEIIKKGVELGVNYGLTWSCYDPQPRRKPRSNVLAEMRVKHEGLRQHDYSPCRRCDSCRLRQKGFREAGFKDPLLT